MNFGFTEEQELLRQEVRKLLDAQSPLAEVRKVAESPEGFSRALWQKIGELGWLGLTVPETHGGAGLGWVDLTVVLEEMGRTLFPSPFLASTLAAAAIRTAGSEAQHERWLPALADGSAIGSVALVERSDRWDAAGVDLAGRAEGRDWVLTGEKVQVMDGAVADLLVVAFRLGSAPDAVALGVVESGDPGLHVEPTPSIDPTRRAAKVRFDGVRIGPDAVLAGAGAHAGATGGHGAGALARLLDRGAAAVAAEAIGAAEGALRLTVDYARQREQFGSPIGRFQGVKHPLAEMYVDVESFKSLLYYAMWCLDEGDADAPRAVSMAKAYASEAFARIGIDAVQLHGGIGYTWEYDAQLYLKRSKWVRPAFGGPDFHYDRVARLRAGAA